MTSEPTAYAYPQMLYKYAPMGLKASVLGASGYAGGELMRLLHAHPAIAVVGAGALSQAGAGVPGVHPHLLDTGHGDFVGLEDAARLPVDVCFSCMPSGALGALEIEAAIVVDLSDDHRASDGWTYGLTEFARAEVATARSIANPGCYPTASLLGLIPFAEAGVIEGPIVIDALSGVSGAGKGLGDPMSFAALHGSATAYGATTHRHVPEIERGLASFGGAELTVSFTPHLVPMARGLLVTARARLTTTTDDTAMLGVLHDAYNTEAFVSVTPDWPSTKSVHGTNRAVVSARVDARSDLLVVSVAIDNLGKGAAGQALQNANLALGLGETSGLEQIAIWP